MKTMTSTEEKVADILGSFAYNLDSFFRLSSNGLMLQCANVAQHLPHGAGIDSAWGVSETSNAVTFSNSYHRMTEHGFYDRWIDFSIKIPKSALGDNETMSQQFKLAFHNDWHIVRDDGLRDYLEDTIYWSLVEGDNE